LLIEVANGDWQQYLDRRLDEVDKMKWCIQVAQAVEYCHQKRVIHCDLRPANCLPNDKLDLRLGDFGASQFGLLSGNRLPDYEFFDPRDEFLTPTEAMDIFGLGSPYIQL
jgi:serine/threonine protein kinase